MFFFLRIATVLLLLLILPALYLHYRYLHRRPRMRIWRYVLWILTSLLAVGTLWYIAYGFRSGKPEWLTYLFFHMWLGVSIAQLSLCIGCLLASLFKRISFLSRAMTYIGIALAAFTLIITIMAYVIGEDCIACGTCIDECPVGAISEGERYSIDPEMCTECGTCADACPSEAISLP